MKDLYILSEDISWISHENAKYIFNDRTVAVIKVNEMLEKLLLFCYMPRHEESIIQNLDSDKITLDEIRLAIANLVKVGILIKNDVQLIEEDSHSQSNLASIAILPTLRCNQNCSYCYNRNSEIDQEIDISLWRRIIKEISTMDSLNHITISGGEPLLRLDVIELFLPLKQAGKEIILGTNATLLTSENIGLIKSAVTKVSVSIDSDIPDIHNETRGDNNFQAVLAGCRLLTKNQIEWQAQSVLTEKNGNSIGKIQKFAESLGASRHVASLELLNGSYSGNKYVEEMESKSFHWDAKKHPLSKHTGCGLGKSYAAIGPDGYIYPCHLLVLDEFRGEPIVGSSLNSAWQALANSNLRKISHVSNVETCNKCMYRNLCGGGCRGIAYLKTGELNGHIGKDACLKFKYDFGKRISATIAEREGQ